MRNNNSLVFILTNFKAAYCKSYTLPSTAMQFSKVMQRNNNQLSNSNCSSKPRLRLLSNTMLHLLQHLAAKTCSSVLFNSSFCKASK